MPAAQAGTAYRCPACQGDCQVPPLLPDPNAPTMKMRPSSGLRAGVTGSGARPSVPGSGSRPAVPGSGARPSVSGSGTRRAVPGSGQRPAVASESTSAQVPPPEVKASPSGSAARRAVVQPTGETATPAPTPQIAPQETVQSPEISSPGSGMRPRIPGSGARPGVPGSGLRGGVRDPNRPGSGFRPRVAGQATDDPRVRGGAGRKPSGGRTMMLAAAGACALVIIVAVAMAISNSQARAEREQNITRLMGEAKAAMEAGEIEKAVGDSAKAQAIINANLAELEAQKVTAWKAVQDEIASRKQRSDDIDRQIASAGKDLKKTRQDLERQLTLLPPKDPSWDFLSNKIRAALADIDAKEREALRAEFQKELKAAEKAYLAGKIEDSVNAAEKLESRIAAQTKVKDAAITKRTGELRELGRVHGAVTRARFSARQDFEGTRKQLDALAKSLSPDNADHKPILAYLEETRKAVAEEEKRFKQFSPADLQGLTEFAQKLAERNREIAIGAAEVGVGVPLTWRGKKVYVTLEGEAKEQVLESDGYRFQVDFKDRKNFLMRYPAAALTIVQRLGEEMKQAAVPPGPPVWKTVHDAPWPVARRTVEDKEQCFALGNVYAGAEKTAEDNAEKILDEAVERLNKDLDGDDKIPDDVRKVVLKLVTGARKDLDMYDFLPKDFSRRALYDGYIEQNVEGAGQRHEPALSNYRKAYDDFTRLRARFDGTKPDGSKFEHLVNSDGHVVYVVYDKAKDVTTFGIRHPLADQRPLLFVVCEFAGKHEQLPEEAKPLAVHMAQPSFGYLSTYRPDGDKFECDRAAWAAAVAIGSHTGTRPYWGSPEWQFPPHVLLVDTLGNPKAIATEFGRVDLPDFHTIADAAKRREAQDAYLDKLAKVLNATGLLHLYFLYFHQYVLDSPVVTCRGLLGSSTASGDIHQNVYESLNRRLGGKYLGDCDDLAEFYMNVTRRQGKLSFVMAVPKHATCGWVEKNGDTYQMQFLDTGPPRIFRESNLDKVVEAGSRSYDEEERTMRFDPRSMGFLFRFAGEPTRTQYWLSTRMFVDKDYAEIMERVQGYWHFHFYALGINTMTNMINKGDRVPENCTELSGLYMFVKELEKGIHWTKEALKQLQPGEELTRVNEEMRVARMYEDLERDDEAFEAMKWTYERLLKHPSTQEELVDYMQRFASSRLEMAGMLLSLDRPWDAWKMLNFDARIRLQQQRTLPLQHGITLTSIYDKMQELIREKGFAPNKEQNDEMALLKDAVLKPFYAVLLFRRDDDIGDILRKYGFMGSYYATLYGKEKLQEELLKPGPFPEKNKNHMDRRKATEEEDWSWIRVSPFSYGFAIGECLDPEDPPEKWRRDDAVKLIERMKVAAKEATRFGSVSSADSVLLTNSVLHAFLTKNWAAFEDVMKDVQRRNFARDTESVAETFGSCARYVTPQEFAAQYKVFTKYVEAKPHYFAVVYDAYRAEAYDHAREAAKLAVAHWPEDQDMKREAEFLETLIKERLKEKAEKDAKKKATEAEKEKKGGAVPPAPKGIVPLNVAPPELRKAG
ncbi:MAG: hypothetical protein L6R28_09310 [Planctomycetes bacterium]|nr:hypothetical protein [Planctomycetota bacterium]